MEDEEEFSCPYCNSTIDCDHLVVVTDLGKICGGEFYESEEMVKSIIVEAMKINNTNLPKVVLDNKLHNLREYWEDWIKEEDMNAEVFV